ncbi:MAG: prepilin-type N-terminal cleavage/methylation domain-containing protein [Methylococcaceae bacterium]|nr:prepilin-type N-terminal cleavage/methylation domain-containing protein [Methylococcaceae bacterium]
MLNTLTHKSGFTLVELMMTIAVASIVLGIGIPSFVSLIDNNRLTAYANDMVGALNLARSESIRRSMQVTVRRKGVSNSNWDAGWEVFTDVDVDGVLDAGTDVLLREYPALSNGVTLRSGDNFACWLAYNSVGLSRGSGSDCNGGLANDSFRLCDSSAQASTSLKIIVSATGRVRICHGNGTDCSGSCPTSTP